MLSKTVLAVVITVLALASITAQAEIVKYKFKGTVTYGGYMAAPGAAITGTFSIDTKVRSATPKIKGYDYASYQMPADLSIAAKVGAHTVVGNNLNVSVYNNLGGNTEDMVTVTGSPAVVDGTTYADGAFGFQLASGPGKTKVLHNTKLPQEFDVCEFDAGPTLNYGFLQSSGQEGGALLQFSIESIKRVQSTHD